VAEQMLHPSNIDLTPHYIDRAFRAQIAQAKVLHIGFIRTAIAPEHGADTVRW
jgi:hypothetical protein